MSAIVLESDEMRVGVLPDYGARVISLLDKRSGREWLQQGASSPNTGEHATYGSAEAIGWDECFPTVGACEAGDTAWRRPMRDHGDLWGRDWTVDGASADSLTTTYSDRTFRFTRELSVDGTHLTARYTVANRSPDSLPYLWALHGLFLATDADRIVLMGVTSVAATYLSAKSNALHAPVQRWPDGDDAVPFALDQVQSPDENFAGKFYAHGSRPRRAALGRDGAWLVIDWGDTIDDLGLWLNYGAWPSFPGGYHVALEPTTASADDLARAIENNSAAVLAPGATHNWTVTLNFRKDLS